MRHRANTLDPVRDPDAAVDAPSKTQRKREAHELQRLGEALAALDAARLAGLALTEPLRAALLEYRHTRSREGRRRQLQYVGKLMRQVDPAPLRAAVAAAGLGAAEDALRLHAAERWRDRLLAHESALAEWLQAHPRSDAAQLRRLLRAARADAASDGASQDPRAARALYRLLRRELDAAAAQPAAAANATSNADPAARSLPCHD